MFKTRSTELERIDTGDYTPEEYETFLREIAFINRYLGDTRALKNTLIKQLERDKLREFSVLDVACGSGELLRDVARFGRVSKRRTCRLVGLDLNPISISGTSKSSTAFPEIDCVRGDAFKLPFADAAFDYAISSLFFHHITDKQIPVVLAEMSRVARRGVFIIDLHRHRAAYALYKLFCSVFRISPLVTHDGSLSILKGFKPAQLSSQLGSNWTVERSLPFRIVISRKVTSI